METMDNLYLAKMDLVPEKVLIMFNTGRWGGNP